MLIDYASIVIPETRQRREFDKTKLSELMESIGSPKGLLHPPVVRNDGITLVAGERRYKAIGELIKAGRQFFHNGELVPLGKIPVTALGELDALSLEEAELEENTIRVDLTWQEKCQAIAKLHRLREKQEGVYDRSSGTGQRLADTATEIMGRPAKGHEVHAVSTALLLEDFLDDIFVQNAKSPQEALKMIREMKTDEERQARAKNFDASKTVHSLTKGDFYVLAKDIPSGTFDVVLTDPPYGKNIHKAKFSSGANHQYDDSDEAFQLVLDKLPDILNRVCKPQAHIYIFCSIVRFTELRVAFELGGFDVWPTPLIWSKGNTGSFANIEVGFRSTYEAIMFANRGARKMITMGPDVFPISHGTVHDHPAQKPVELYEELLRRSCLPGDRVLDCYAGSGPIFPAAHKVKVIAHGYEISDKYHAIAAENLSQIKA